MITAVPLLHLSMAKPPSYGVLSVHVTVQLSNGPRRCPMPPAGPGCAPCAPCLPHACPIPRTCSVQLSNATPLQGGSALFSSYMRACSLAHLLVHLFLLALDLLACAGAMLASVLACLLA